MIQKITQHIIYNTIDQMFSHEKILLHILSSRSPTDVACGNVSTGSERQKLPPRSIVLLVKLLLLVFPGKTQTPTSSSRKIVKIPHDFSLTAYRVEIVRTSSFRNRARLNCLGFNRTQIKSLSHRFARRVSRICNKRPQFRRGLQYWPLVCFRSIASYREESPPVKQRKPDGDGNKGDGIKGGVMKLTNATHDGL